MNSSGVMERLRRMARRRRQITLATALCIIFDDYHKMMLYRRCLDNTNTYEQAEEMAERFSEIFGMDVPVGVFLPDERNYDRSIEQYRLYKKHGAVIEQFGYTQEDLDAFCRQVEYAPYKTGLQTFFAMNSIGFMYAMKGVFDYTNGLIGKDQLEILMAVYSPPGMRLMTKAQRYCFAKTMFRLVREFDCIVEKRRSRKKKR